MIYRCYCCLQCDPRIKCLWFVKENFTLGNRLRFTQCSEFLLDTTETRFRKRKKNKSYIFSGPAPERGGGKGLTNKKKRTFFNL